MEDLKKGNHRSKTKSTIQTAGEPSNSKDRDFLDSMETGICSDENQADEMSTGGAKYILMAMKA
jgi:hypothetical protein